MPGYTAQFNTLTMMVELMVEDEKKSSDLTEAEVVAEAQTLAYDALIKAQEANRALARLKEMRARLSKPASPLSKPTAPLSKPTAPLSKTNSSLSKIDSPLSQTAPLVEPRRPESDMTLKVRTAMEHVALSRAEQPSTSVEEVESPIVEIAPSFTPLPKAGSILNKSTPGPKAVGFAERGRNSYAPPEPSFPDPFGGPEGLWGDYDVDHLLCGVAPSYEYDGDYAMPEEDSIIATKAVVAPVVKIESFVGVAAPPEQSFPDPFGGNHNEACGDVDVDRMCGVITYDDEEFEMEELKNIQAQQMKLHAQELQKMAEEESQAQQLKIQAKELQKMEEAPMVEAPVVEAPKEEAPKEEAPKEETPKEEAPMEEAPKEEAPKEETPKEEAQMEEAPKTEAPKEEAPAAEKTAVSSPVKSVAAVGLTLRPEQPFPDPFGGIVDDDAFDVDVDRLCGLLPIEDVPMITAQPKQIQAQQQEPTSPVASPAAAKSVEETVDSVVEPTKSVSPEEEPAVAAKAPMVSSAETIAAVDEAVLLEQPVAAIVEDTFSFDRLCGVSPDQVQPTSPVEEPVKSVVELTKSVSLKEEPAVAAEAPMVSAAETVAAVNEAVSPEQPVAAVAEDTFSFDRLCGATPDQVEPTSPVPALTDAKCVEVPKEIEESTVDIANTPTPAVVAEVAKIEAPKEEFTVDTDNAVTPVETTEVKPLEAATAPTTPEAPKEESGVALEASPRAADLASEEGQKETKGVYAALDNLCRSPQAQEQNEIQVEKLSPAPKPEEVKPEAPQAEEQNKLREEPKVSPAPKQEEAKPEEQLQLESQEHMIQAQAANACGCVFF